MVHSCNPTTSEVEARGQQVPREPLSYSEFRSLCLGVLRKFEASLGYMRSCLKEQMLFHLLHFTFRIHILKSNG